MVITVSLMVLLTVVAVGLLSLSSIALRSASREDAMSTARANARLAMLMALNDLQTSTGPDQRVTASAAIRGNQVVQRNLTGVWRGWKWNGEGTPPNHDTRKQNNISQQGDFVRWLVSSP